MTQAESQVRAVPSTDHARKRLYLYEIYMKEGDALFNRGNYEKAKDNYKEHAMDDAEGALRMNDAYLPAVYQKAQILYLQGSYEWALRTFTKGHRLSPDAPEFLEGIKKSQFAMEILNVGCIKKTTAVGDLSLYESWKNAGSSTKSRLLPEVRKSGFRHPRQQNETTSETRLPSPGFSKRQRIYAVQTRHRLSPSLSERSYGLDEKQWVAENLNDRNVRNILGELYRDKQFLEMIQKDFNSTDGGNNLSRRLSIPIGKGSKFLNDRVIYWNWKENSTFPPIHGRRQRSETPSDACYVEKDSSDSMNKAQRSRASVKDPETSAFTRRKRLPTYQHKRDNSRKSAPVAVASGRSVPKITHRLTNRYEDIFYTPEPSRIQFHFDSLKSIMCREEIQPTPKSLREGGSKVSWDLASTHDSSLDSDNYIMEESVEKMKNRKRWKQEQERLYHKYYQQHQNQQEIRDTKTLDNKRWKERTDRGQPLHVLAYQSSRDGSTYGSHSRFNTHLEPNNRSSQQGRYTANRKEEQSKHRTETNTEISQEAVEEEETPGLHTGTSHGTEHETKDEDQNQQSSGKRSSEGNEEEQDEAVDDDDSIDEMSEEEESDPGPETDYMERPITEESLIKLIAKDRGIKQDPNQATIGLNKLLKEIINNETGRPDTADTHDSTIEEKGGVNESKEGMKSEEKDRKFKASKEAVRTPQTPGIDPDKQMKKELKLMAADFNKKKFDEVIKRGNKVMMFMKKAKNIEAWSKRRLNNFAKVHSYMGNASSEKRNFDKARLHHNAALKIGLAAGETMIQSRALEQLACTFILENKHVKALECFTKRARLPRDTEDTARLFLEIANCFITLQAYEFAKDAASVSLRAANEGGHSLFQMQSSTLLAVMKVKLRRNSAKETFIEALEYAENRDDTEASAAMRCAIRQIEDAVDTTEACGPNDKNGEDARAEESDAIATVAAAQIEDKVEEQGNTVHPADEEILDEEKGESDDDNNDVSSERDDREDQNQLTRALNEEEESDF